MAQLYCVTFYINLTKTDIIDNNNHKYYVIVEGESEEVARYKARKELSNNNIIVTDIENMMKEYNCIEDNCIYNLRYKYNYEYSKINNIYQKIYNIYEKITNNNYINNIKMDDVNNINNKQINIVNKLKSILDLSLTNDAKHIIKYCDTYVNKLPI